MLPWLAATADPGRVHTEGRLARAAVEDARERVAALLGARPREVVFTSGATESIATAVFGAAERGSHAVCPAVEHSAVREASARLDVTVVDVDKLGRVDPHDISAAIQPGRTALVHVQLANHEVGTIQPVADVAAACRDRGVLVHVDAAAAAGHVAIDFAGLGADLLSVSAHKFGGPAGVGALLVRRGVRLRPLLAGGDQERGRRAGAENVAGIVGFGAAAKALAGSVPERSGGSVPERSGGSVPERSGGSVPERSGGSVPERSGSRLGAEALVARHLTERALVAALAVGGVTAYGDTEDRVPHLVCLGVEGVEAEAVLIGLDQAGIAVHSGSACSSESLEPSPVLEAMGVDANRSLRVSTGWTTTESDIDAFAQSLPMVVANLRALG